MAPSSKSETTEKVAEKAHETVDKAAESAGKAEERIRETTEKARAQSEDILVRVSEYVQENPLTALGLAFAAGTIFSSMTRRR